MFALFSSIRTVEIETPDTGTFADGALQMPRVELRSVARQDRIRSAHTKDYGADRKACPAAYSYA